MNENVTIVIGDNAVGKTRYLQNLQTEFLNNKICVVSNLNNYLYESNLNKKNVILESGSQYLQTLILNGGVSYYDLCVYNLLRHIISNGDVLIIDELDHILKRQHLIDFCSVLSQLRDYWKWIFVSGYSPDLTRLFTYISYDDDGYFGSKITKANLLVLKDNKSYKITDGVDAYEYFYEIRR